jgi:hypothetical protein
LAEAGADMTRVTVPFSMSTDGDLALSISDVKLVATTEGQLLCPKSVGSDH